MPSRSKHYRGWTYDYDHSRPVTGRWAATRAGVGMCHNTEEGLRKMIDTTTSEWNKEPAPKYDFRVINHGSILLLTPLNDAAKAWVRETAPEDAQWWVHDQLVVEPRYIENVVAHAEEAGFAVVYVI